MSPGLSSLLPGAFRTRTAAVDAEVVAEVLPDVDEVWLASSSHVACEEWACWRYRCCGSDRYREATLKRLGEPAPQNPWHLTFDVDDVGCRRHVVGLGVAVTQHRHLHLGARGDVIEDAVQDTEWLVVTGEGFLRRSQR